MTLILMDMCSVSPVYDMPCSPSPSVLKSFTGETLHMSKAYVKEITGGRIARNGLRGI